MDSSRSRSNSESLLNVITDIDEYSVSPAKRPPKKTSKAQAARASGAAKKRTGQPLDRVALLAHQLKSPLSTINALAQGMMRRAEKMSAKDVRARAERVWKASLHLEELIDMILSYTRASAGAMQINPRAFNPEALILRACREQNNQDPERPFIIDIHDLPDTIIGDPILLEQAFVIVLSNAMKYSKRDKPITVSSYPTGDGIEIAVKDEGIGISELDMPFLMQPFYRGQNAKELPGTGLGLSLAWHILKLHGGEIAIDSAKDRGTTVTLIIPRKNIPGAGGAL